MDDELPLVGDPDVDGRDEANESEEPVDEAPKNDVPGEDEDDVPRQDEDEVAAPAARAVS
jgi:hypothetical protein